MYTINLIGYLITVSFTLYCVVVLILLYFKFYTLVQKMIWYDEDQFVLPYYIGFFIMCIGTVTIDTLNGLDSPDPAHSIFSAYLIIGVSVFLILGKLIFALIDLFGNLRKNLPPR